jgi:hypothetical protein
MHDAKITLGLLNFLSLPIFYATLFFKTDEMKKSFNKLAEDQPRDFIDLLLRAPKDFGIEKTAKGLLNKKALQKIKEVWNQFIIFNMYDEI